MQKIQILSSIPGRIRLKYNPIAKNSKIAIIIEKELFKHDYIDNVSVSSITSTILLKYDYKVISVKKIIELVINQELSVVSDTTIENSMVPLNNPIESLDNRTLDFLKPKKLSIPFQKKQLLFSGAVLAYTLIKKFIIKTPLFSLSPINIASVTTVATGLNLFKNALYGLVKERKFNNDFLITTATALSLYMRESITGLVVIWLINLSELFEELTVDNSRKAIRKMLSNTDDKAWILEDGKEVSIDANSLTIDDTVIVHSGEKIPVDGIVIHGEASVNQAPITGESMPVLKENKSQVFAGTIVEQGIIYISAKKVGDDTSIARIIHLVEEASKTRAPIQNIADKYSEKLIPYSFLLSGLVYLMTGDFVRAITILIVACPCAAGLATPTALAAAMGNAAKRGILIKGGKYLETIGKVDSVFFDKTGTLTHGKPEITSIYTLDESVSVDDALYLAASCEQGNRHPLATTIVNKATDMNIVLDTPEHVEIVIGKGVHATINNEKIIVGSRNMIQEHNISLSEGNRYEEAVARNGETTIYVAKNEKLVALIGAKDIARQESLVAIENLNKRGIDDIAMITGDNEATALAIASKLMIKRAISNVLPEDKAMIVREEINRGKKVLMVGDGVNDSPALALADIGVAMGTGGTDIAIESADIVISGDNPTKIVEAIDISRHTIKIIKQSYNIALAVNSLGIILGAFNLISPFLGAIMHNASTLGVVVNSSRLLKYDKEI